MDDLAAFVKEQLRIHKEIMGIVKEYIDEICGKMGIDLKKDKSTYLAMILELTRSIFVNYSVKQRYTSYRRKQ